MTRKINSLEDVHCVRDAGVAGSNPATPTILSSTYSNCGFEAQRNAGRAPFLMITKCRPYIQGRAAGNSSAASWGGEAVIIADPHNGKSVKFLQAFGLSERRSCANAGVLSVSLW